MFRLFDIMLPIQKCPNNSGVGILGKLPRLFCHSCSSSHCRSSIHSSLEFVPKSREALLTKKHTLSRKESDCDKLLLSRTEKTEKRLIYYLCCFWFPQKVVQSANWGRIYCQAACLGEVPWLCQGSIYVSSKHVCRDCDAVSLQPWVQSCLWAVQAKYGEGLSYKLHKAIPRAGSVEGGDLRQTAGICFWLYFVAEFHRSLWCWCKGSGAWSSGEGEATWRLWSWRISYPPWYFKCVLLWRCFLSCNSLFVLFQISVCHNPTMTAMLHGWPRWCVSLVHFRRDLFWWWEGAHHICLSGICLIGTFCR